MQFIALYLILQSSKDKKINKKVKILLILFHEKIISLWLYLQKNSTVLGRDSVWTIKKQIKVMKNKI